MGLEHKCTLCTKNKEHDTLYAFGPYGNNPLKIKDYSEGRFYCLEHFEQVDLELSNSEES